MTVPRPFGSTPLAKYLRYVPVLVFKDLSLLILRAAPLWTTTYGLSPSNRRNGGRDGREQRGGTAPDRHDAAGSRSPFFLAGSERTFTASLAQQANVQRQTLISAHSLHNGARLEQERHNPLYVCARQCVRNQFSSWWHNFQIPSICMIALAHSIFS